MPKLSIKQLTLLALLLSVNIFLQGPFLKLDFAGVTQFGFSFIPSALTGVIFGPIYGFVIGGVADLVSFFVFPSGYPFFPGYTLSAALGPLLYGLFLYKKPLTLPRIFTVVLFITVFINIGLGTLWVSMLQGKAFLALLPVRITKNVVSLIINTVVLTALFKLPAIQRLIKEYEL